MTFTSTATTNTIQRVIEDNLIRSMTTLSLKKKWVNSSVLATCLLLTIWQEHWHAIEIPEANAIKPEFSSSLCQSLGPR